ncbi:MAG: quinol:electron acceptor oxidoreductase subunit ActD [Chloroflexota bacterium]
MNEPSAHVAVFDDVNPAADAIVRLREIGILENDMEVISGVPFAPHILGRADPKTYVPLLGALGALVGLAAAIAFNFGTPLLYPMYVGGQPLQPIPPGLLLAFEMSMLGLLIFSFIGVMIENAYPALFSRKLYHPAVSDGKIAIFFRCPAKFEHLAYETLQKLGAEEVGLVEAKVL